MYVPFAAALAMAIMMMVYQGLFVAKAAGERTRAGPGDLRALDGRPPVRWRDGILFFVMGFGLKPPTWIVSWAVL